MCFPPWSNMVTVWCEDSKGAGEDTWQTLYTQNNKPNQNTAYDIELHVLTKQAIWEPETAGVWDKPYLWNLTKLPFPLKIASFSDEGPDPSYFIITATGTRCSKLLTGGTVTSPIMTNILHVNHRLQTIRGELNLTFIQSLILFVQSSARREHSILS